jgi:hypothetical protein
MFHVYKGKKVLARSMFLLKLFDVCKGNKLWAKSRCLVLLLCLICILCSFKFVIYCKL